MKISRWDVFTGITGVIANPLFAAAVFQEVNLIIERGENGVDIHSNGVANSLNGATDKKASDKRLQNLIL